jgi:NADPH:quinone reductase-like Zn-dependent oxidoreductase
MKAAVIDAFGPAESLEIRDIEKPVPGQGQVLIQTCAASVNPIDWKIRQGMMSDRFGSDFPMVLGFDVSGEVAAVSDDVTGFSIGDPVYARSDNGPGNCYAEFVAVSASVVGARPASLSHAEAASIPLVGLTAFNGLRHCADLAPGQRLLVNGASGGVGTVAVQMGKAMGAHVTGVCSSPNADLVTELGADSVIDYTCSDPLAGGEQFDVIFDAVGTLELERAQSRLTGDGVYLTLVPGPGSEMFFPGRSERRAGGGYFVVWTPSGTDLDVLTAWIEAGELRPVIDSQFPLDDIRAAHLHSETERARGKIVLTI